MREVCRQFDNLNLAFDELIAQIEADSRKSSLTAYPLGKIQPVSQATESER
jgi:hypothetical protein